MKPLLILALSILLINCSDSSPSSKNLFSLWTHQETGAPMDLSDGAFSEPLDYSFFFTEGNICDCTLTIMGSQSSGSYYLNSCYYRMGSGSGDPGCNYMNGSGTYNKLNYELTLFQDGRIATYY